MPPCEQCRYNLTGLARDAAPVRCPECGGLTPHHQGEPLPTSRTPRHYWACVCGPGLALFATAALTTVVTAAGERPWTLLICIGLGWAISPAATATLLVTVTGDELKRMRREHRLDAWLTAMLIAPTLGLFAPTVGFVLLGLISSPFR